MAQDGMQLQDVMQLLIAVLGILSQLLVVGRALRKRAPKEGSQDEIVGAAPVTRRDARPERYRSRLDLSFVLVCAAFLSLLITDSLVISGRNPSAGWGTILKVLAITLLVFGTMFGAWFLSKTELVTGFLALTTLFVLIISPGGPFNDPTQTGETGLWLLIPVVSLTILSSTMLVYCYGSPLSSSMARGRRLLVSSIFAGLVIIAAVTLGQQFVRTVSADPLTPKIEAVEAKELLPVVLGADIKEQRNFYRLASEINLASTYQKQFRAQKDQQKELQPPQREETGQGPPQQVPPPQGITNRNASTVQQTPPAHQRTNADTNSASSRQSQPPQQTNTSPPTQQRANADTNSAPPPQIQSPHQTSTSNSIPSPAARKQQAVAEVLGMIRADNDRLTEQAFHSWMGRSNSLAKSDLQDQGRRQGSERILILVKYCETLDNNEKEDFLARRLEWIHPVGLENQSEATIPLPGLTATDRLDDTSRYRIYQSLADQEPLRAALFKEFSYPDEIRTAFDGKNDYINYRARRFVEMDPGRHSSLYKRLLFPKLEPNANSAILMEQLALPSNIEGYVAYSEYKQLALLLIERDFQSNVSDEKRQKITGTFSALDDATQEAFLLYVVNNKNHPFEDVNRMLIDLSGDLNGANFSSFVNSQDPLVVKKLAAMIERPNLPDSDVGLKQLSDGIRNKNRDSWELLIKMLKEEDPKVPIKRIFQNEVFKLIDEVNRNVGAEKKALYDALADPVWQAIREIASVGAARSESTFKITDALSRFRALKAPDQEGLLLQIAISLYQPGGEYSLDPIRLMVVQAKLYHDYAALVCASLIMLPLLLVSVLVGGFFSRKLVARDRVRELVSREVAGSSEMDKTFAHPVELYGRSDVLCNLRSLAERGWSTIGVVGRRGVGKSRLLYALSHSEADRRGASTVKVWVSSPSKFQEEDFICSMFERLALSTEAAIAGHMGVKPISTRRIEARTALIGAWLYASVVIVLGVVFYSMASRLTRPDIVFTWLPILALVFASIGVYVNYVSKLQPVDLSSWLQRDRTHSPHSVLLYKEVFDVLKFLRRRARNISSDDSWSWGNVLRFLAMGVLGIVFLYSLWIFVIGFDRLSSLSTLSLLVLGIGSLAGMAFLYQNRNVSKERLSAQGQSLMTLIAEYRSFAATIVYRLKQGALGHPQERKFSVLICIDELDKIVEFEDIRTFVRRIKAIFEVPGLYYYVSLAEDTLTALYLGPAEGKNEIDSSFDHIVRIPPVSCDIGEDIAADYLKSHGVSDASPRLARTIATLSFGIPRDIIRRCDEFIARGKPSLINPQELGLDLRKAQALMGYELQHLTRVQMANLSDTSKQCAYSSQQMRADDRLNETSRRLVLSIWLISLIEISLDLLDEERWLKASDEACRIGYKLPIDQVSDLEDQLERMHSALVAKEELASAPL